MQAAAASYKRPWFWLPVLFGLAVVATLLLAFNARSRIAQNERQFEASQQLRLGSMEVHIDDYFATATELAAAGAETLAPVRGDRATAARIVAELYRARRNRDIFGLGAFYAPGAFDPALRLFSIYSESARDGVTIQFVQGPHDENYFRYSWWREAADARGETTFGGPYWEDHKSFISTMQAFYDGGRLEGVMTVDTLTGTFKRMMIAQLAPGDIAWVEGRDHRTWILGTAQIPQGGDRLDRAIPLRYTHSFVHLSSDASPLHATNARIVTASFALCVAGWLFTILLSAILMQNWRSRENTMALETERERLERELAIGREVAGELRKAAYTDGLTGLPNRNAFLERGAEAILAQRSGDDSAVLMIDLDRFNIVNETLGHFAGDELLKAVAARLIEALPSGSWIGRLGGDEFVALLHVAASAAVGGAGELIAALRRPLLLGGRVFYMTASIGVLAVDEGYGSPEELLRDADIAMYEAKRRGRSQAVLFDTEMRRRVAAESEMELDMRLAIERRNFVPYYQPIVDTVQCAPVSFEALVRWVRDDGSIVEATDFIPYAERHGIVDAIDALVLEDVCRNAAALFARFPDATVAVNVSAAHLTAPDLAESIAGTLRAHNVSPERVKLEITETAIMSNAGRARDTLDRLRVLGMQIILDDFGAGHSSLAYLHRLPIAGLKIDRSFVEPLPSDDQALAIVRSIVALAKTLGLYTVAEGVEHSEQLAALRQLGVDYAQGYLFAPARDLDGLFRWEALRTG